MAKRNPGGETEELEDKWYHFNIPVHNTEMLLELDENLETHEAKEQFVSE